LILYHVFKKDYHDIYFPIKEQKELELMLYTFGNINSNYYLKFKKYLDENIKPYESYLFSSECRKKIDNNILVFNIDNNTIDLTELKEYSFWANFVRNLFKSLVRNIIFEITSYIDPVDKANIVKKLYTILIQYRHLFFDKFGLCYGCFKFYNSIIKKLIDFAREGAEFAIYTFAILCPKMMTNNCLLNLNTSGSLYNKVQLKIEDNDVIFSESLLKFKQYY